MHVNTVFLLQHSYALEGTEETKTIGLYRTREDAEAAIERLRPLPGFRDHPDDFFIDEYPLNQDHWTEGFATLTSIDIPDSEGHWITATAECLPDGTYRICEGLDDEFLGKFKTGDTVRCEKRDGHLFAVEKFDAAGGEKGRPLKTG